MTTTTPAGAPAREATLEDALLAVELELMRTPALARLNGARRREISRGILDALNARGVLAGITDPQVQPLLLAA
ncbi:hypothetical protein IV500_05480 [Paeniglutamicibacter antarcticus]|uniref:Uncharacterized protein n=1 Tax=Arthrobacter terrae TaxID=2935737 RepID=A0A931CKY7_9MICC|nr:hypothetical protein [Arthrobacter terrae]MBG0738872.1 hypothetical protein [Arthrobacter terrae]